MNLRTRQRDTLDPAVQQHLEWLSLNWKTYFSSSSSSTWTESPTWWSSSSWDHQWQDWHSPGWQDKEFVGSAVKTTTPESLIVFFLILVQGDLYGKKSERQGLSQCQVRLNPASIRSLAHFSDFCSFWQFRVQRSGNCHERDGGVYREHLTVRTTHALFLAAHARTPDVITRLAQGLDDLFVCLKNHSIIGHVFVECSFGPRFLLFSLHLLPH